MKLQGKKQNISLFVAHIEGFRKKFMLLRASLQRNDATHFSPCSELLGEEKNFDFSVFFEKIFEISDEFNDTFANFDLLNTKAEVFSNPIEVDVEPQPLHLQQKSC